MSIHNERFYQSYNIKEAKGDVEFKVTEQKDLRGRSIVVFTTKDKVHMGERIALMLSLTHLTILSLGTLLLTKEMAHAWKEVFTGEQTKHVWVYKDVVSDKVLHKDRLRLYEVKDVLSEIGVRKKARLGEEKIEISANLYAKIVSGEDKIDGYEVFAEADEMFETVDEENSPAKFPGPFQYQPGKSTIPHYYLVKTEDSSSEKRTLKQEAARLPRVHHDLSEDKVREKIRRGDEKIEISPSLYVKIVAGEAMVEGYRVSIDSEEESRASAAQETGAAKFEGPFWYKPGNSHVPRYYLLRDQAP